MSKSSKDQLYATKLDKIEDFVFDERVANVFEDMIRRSVPGYLEINQQLPKIAEKFIQPNSSIYDLGCSLGAASLSINNVASDKNISIFAVDNSQAMIDKLLIKINMLGEDNCIYPKCADVTEIQIENASFAVMNYTLQFIDQDKRDDLIKNIYSGLLNDGALFLSEKIKFDDLREEASMQELHEDFKKENDYSELEISQKRESLENVLIKDTKTQHIERLKKAGFTSVSALTERINFCTFLAIK